MPSTSFVQTLLGAPRLILTFIRRKPVISGLVAIVLLGGCYWGYTSYTSTNGETRYVLGEARRGTLTVSVSGSGQVSAENQLDLTARASGDIVSIPVKNGTSVKRGALIAQIDARTAQKAVRDAQVNLESAKLALQKLEQPATALELTQAKNNLSDAESNLAQAYDDGFNEVSDTFLALPDIMSGLDDVLYDNTVSLSQDNVYAYADLVDDIEPGITLYRTAAINGYADARAAYDKQLTEYKTASRFSDKATIEKLILETYDTTKAVAEAAKSVSDLLNVVNDSLVSRERTVPTLLTTHRTSLTSFLSELNAQLVALLAIKDTIQSSKQSTEENTEALRDLEDGTDVLDIASQKLVVKQRENALRDAEEDLADYYVRAPFDGTVAKLSVERGDRVSSGASIATFITANAVAEISLNEIDAAQIAVGQKAKLTFDAVENLDIDGAVVEIDTVGTVASGVVTYTVTIGFDTDERIKPGMTVNADIVTKTVDNALLIPASAIKTERDRSYVETILGASAGREPVASTNALTKIYIEVGTTNDTHVEVLSGLEEGYPIITRTISAEAEAAAPTIFQATGARPPGGGGNFRPQGR